MGITTALERNFAERKKVHEIINLGGSKTISLNEMVEVLEDCLGKKARRRVLAKQAGDAERTHADITKANRLLQYEPYTDFRTGVGEFISWLNAPLRMSA